MDKIQDIMKYLIFKRPSNPLKSRNIHNDFVRPCVKLRCANYGELQYKNLVLANVNVAENLVIAEIS